MLPYPAPPKRTPIIAAYISDYNEGTELGTLHIVWDTPKSPIYRYNGQYFISEADLGAAEDLTTEWDAAEPLPDQNAAGETSTEEAEKEEVAMGTYAYARVRVGRAAGGWGDYGYLTYTVAAPGEGGGVGPSGITDLISITDLYETLHEIDVVDGCIQTYTETPAALAIKLAFITTVQQYSLTVVWMTNKLASTYIKYRVSGEVAWIEEYDSGTTYAQYHYYTIENLVPSTDYEIYVQSDIADPVESVNTTMEATTMALALPAEPVALPATDITDDGFTANWYAAAGADSYLLDVNTSPDFDGTIILADQPVADLFYAVSGLDPAADYYYRISGVNDIGEGEYSNVVYTVTLCEAPVALAAELIGGNQFDAVWQQAVGAEYYQLDVAMDELFTSFVLGYENKTIRLMDDSVGFTAPASATTPDDDVELTSPVLGAAIYYLIGATGLDDFTDQPDVYGIEYTEALHLGNGPHTIYAIAVLDGYVNSDVASETYTISGQVATPVITLSSDDPITFESEHSISCSTLGSTIYYTINGDTPTSASTEYTGPFTIAYGDNIRIRAIAVKTLWDDSEVAVSAEFSVVPDALTASIAGVSSTVIGISTSSVCVIPVGAGAGDLLVACVMHRDTLTPPSGWDVADMASNSFPQYITILYKTAEVGDAGTNVTFTQASSQRIISHIIAITSTSSLAIIDTATNYNNTGPTNGVYPMAELAATQTGQIAISAVTCVYGGDNWSAHSGWTLTTPASETDNRLACAYKILDDEEVTSGNFTGITTNPQISCGITALIGMAS